MTAGELISAVIQFYLNQAGQDYLNRDTRRKAEFHLQALAGKAWAKAPWSWKRASAQIQLPADGDGQFTFPANYLGSGTRGVLFILGQRTEVRWRSADVIMRLRALGGGSAARPLVYGMQGQTDIGLKIGLVHPINTTALTLELENYDRLPPLIVDRPIAPTVALGAAGAYTGTRSYRVTYVTAAGETEGSAASTPIVAVAQKITVTIPVSLNPRVTARKLYATATLGTQHKLLATVANNVTTTYSDEALDGTLGANVPDFADAVTGLELFPAGYHESVFYEGLKARLMNNQGDMRDTQADQEFDKGVRDMWINSKEDRNRIVRLARYGT